MKSVRSMGRQNFLESRAAGQAERGIGVVVNEPGSRSFRREEFPRE